MAAVDFDETAFWDDELTPEKAGAYTKRKESAAAAGPQGKDIGRTPTGFMQNAYEGAGRGSIGGPYGAIGGAISEGLIGLIGGQKAIDKWRGMTPGPQLAEKLKKQKAAMPDADHFGEGYAGAPDTQMPGGTQSEMGDFELGSEWA